MRSSDVKPTGIVDLITIVDPGETLRTISITDSTLEVSKSLTLGRN